MPELRYCKECRKLFQYVSGIALCPECKKKDDKEFEQVRSFLRDYPGANMQEVSQYTGVNPNKINRWLKEERLEVSEGSPVAINCEKCGVRIRSGRFCVECSKSLAREIMQARNEMKRRLGMGDKSNASFDKDEFGLYYKHKRDK